tara:strand:+ start:13236 stop:13532 length:297 start_codon:yes stop_codon:yes gene_type:complete
MNNKKNIGYIFGFIGAFLLIIRLYPILYEQLTSKKRLNLKYLTIELLATLFLGTSAFMLNALPFLIANSITFLNVIILMFCQLKLINDDDINSVECNV